MGNASKEFHSWLYSFASFARKNNYKLIGNNLKALVLMWLVLFLLPINRQFHPYSIWSGNLYFVFSHNHRRGISWWFEQDSNHLEVQSMLVHFEDPNAYRFSWIIFSACWMLLCVFSRTRMIWVACSFPKAEILCYESVTRDDQL